MSKKKADAHKGKGKHEWVAPYGAIRWPHCRRCGIIRRADGENSPCKGASRVGPRGE